MTSEYINLEVPKEYLEYIKNSLKRTVAELKTAIWIEEYGFNNICVISSLSESREKYKQILKEFEKNGL